MIITYILPRVWTVNGDTNGTQQKGSAVSDCPIVFENLRKEYRNFTAVDDLCLEIRKNSFTGLLGPNGAGKSTSLKILTNLIHATSGHVYLNGYDVVENPKLALTGVGSVVETPEFYLYLTPRETFRYIGEILGMTKESVASDTDRILEEVRMSEWADKKLGTFSKGMRQRIAIGLSLLDNPNIIILDEPTSGLDPRGMAEMREILKNIRNNNNNLTVLMSSHMMHDVADLCDRVAVINHGKLMVHDTIDKITESHSTKVLIAKPLDTPTEHMVDAIGSLPGVVSSERDGNEIRIGFKGEMADVAALYRGIAALDFPVCGLSENPNALEDSYLDLVKESR